MLWSFYACAIYEYSRKDVVGSLGSATKGRGSDIPATELFEPLFCSLYSSKPTLGYYALPSSAYTVLSYFNSIYSTISSPLFFSQFLIN